MGNQGETERWTSRTSAKSALMRVTEWTYEGNRSRKNAARATKLDD